MGRDDRSLLAGLDWSHIVIDEGHWLKNAKCKLNAELEGY
jgi:SNF2 family DNA or RNA helicase